MNRRTSLKNILLFGALGTASFSVFKWIKLNQPIDPAALQGKRELIAELVELIIPTTDTPGAKAAGVHDYIIGVMLNCKGAKEQEKFYNGLTDIEAYTADEYNQPFLKCTKDQKNAALKYAMDHGEYSNRILNKINNKLLGQPFFAALKELTVQGYCISRTGATEALAYDYIPGTFSACIPIQKNQKSWATK